MALIRHDDTQRSGTGRGMDLFDRLFEDRMNLLRRPMLLWPDTADVLHVEEFREDGVLVVRVEAAGIDPDKDVEITVRDQEIHLHVERREEEKTKERDYVRQEIRYGAFSRTMPLPAGVRREDIKASYKDGILEIRVPAPASEPPTKVPVAKG